MKPRQTVPRPLTTPRNLALACAATCAVTVVALTAGLWDALLARRVLLDGAVAVLWLAGATGAGLAILRLSPVRFESTALQIVCAAALGTGLESLLVLLLGLAGALNVVTAWTIVVIGLAMLVWGVPPLAKRAARVEVRPWSWLWLLAMPGFGVAFACAFLPPGLLWGSEEPNGYDVVSYHFQLPREWFELGRITSLRHNVFSHFPLGVEMHYLLAMHLRGGPWAGMYAAQLVHVGFVALAVVAVYGVLRELGAPRATLGAVAAATTPWMIMLAPIGYNEGGVLLYGTLAVGLMMVALKSSTPLPLCALAGAMAGFACGTKLTAVPMVLLTVPVAVLVRGFLRPPLPPGEGWGEGVFNDESLSDSNPPSPQPPPGARGGRKNRALIFIVPFIAVGAVVFLPWPLRNIAWTGNPFFPESANAFGRAHFSPEQVERWQRAHGPREDQRNLAARGREFSNQVLLDWRFGYALLPLACAAAALEWRRRETLYLLPILLLITILWLFFTHLQGRFYVFAIPLAAMLVGLLRDARTAVLAASVVVIAGVAGVANVYAALRAKPVIFQAIGLERLTPLTPLADVTLRDDEQVILLGDAQPFLYDVSTGRLQYRTVFDVPTDDWMSGMRVEPGKTIVLVDPNELARFARTYRNLPPIPRAAMNRTGPYVERR